MTGGIYTRMIGEVRPIQAGSIGFCVRFGPLREVRKAILPCGLVINAYTKNATCYLDLVCAKIISSVG